MTCRSPVHPSISESTRQLVHAVYHGKVRLAESLLAAGADIHVNQGQVLATALERDEPLDKFSMARWVSQKMFGSDAFSTILLLRGLGYTDNDIVKHVVNKYHPAGQNSLSPHT